MLWSATQTASSIQPPRAVTAGIIIVSPTHCCALIHSHHAASPGRHCISSTSGPSSSPHSPLPAAATTLTSLGACVIPDFAATCAAIFILIIFFIFIIPVIAPIIILIIVVVTL